MKKKLLVSLSIVAALVLSFTALVVYAYYSTLPKVYTSDDSTGQAARIGMRINLLFDKMIGYSGDLSYPNGITVAYREAAPWGTAENPYVINVPRHMNNLSALQDVGYFKERFIDNYDPSDPSTANTSMPYFLVCERDGTPVVVDGDADGDGVRMKIRPIGNDEYPFIGVIGGAQTSGTAEAPNGYTSISSVFANFIVEADPDQPDIGLFGTIGYLGDPETTHEVEGMTVFDGASSAISDLLLYDISIVSNKSFTASLAGHRLINDAAVELFGAGVDYREDHHIGIFVGHAEYSTLENISVYYTSNDVKAIDVDQTGANYYSDSGIIGFVYHLNPSRTGNSIGCETGSTIAGQTEGAGNEWGGSIDMKAIYDRLSARWDLASANPVQISVGDVITTHYDINGVQVGDPTTVSETTPASGFLITYAEYDGSDQFVGSYTFARWGGDWSLKQYLYLYGEDDITSRVKAAHLETVNGRNLLTDGNGHYLSVTYSSRYQGSISDTTDPASASAFTLTDNGDGTYKISTTVSYYNTTYTYYLCRNNANLIAYVANYSYSYNWYATNGIITNSSAYSNNYYFINYGSSWRLSVFSDSNLPYGTDTKTVINVTCREKEAFTITDGSGNYLKANFDGTLENTTDSAQATNWMLDSNKIVTQITNPSNEYDVKTLYLSNSGGSLSLDVGSTTTIWVISRSSIRTGSPSMYLNCCEGVWNLRDTITYFHLINNRSTYSVNIAGADYSDWFRDSSDRLFVITRSGSTLTPHYLRNNNGSLEITTTVGDASAWTFADNRVSNNGLYLSTRSGSWFLSPAAETYIFHDSNNNYLKLTGSSLSADTEANATEWVITGSGSSCRIRNGSNYLYNNNGVLGVTSSEGSAGLWTVNSGSLTMGSLTLAYDGEYWRLVEQSGAVRVICDGSGHFLSVGSGTTLTNSGKDRAADWSFSTMSGTGTISTVIGGTTYYLYNNSGVLGLRTSAFNWTVDGTHISANGLYLTYSSGWVLSSPITRYKISGQNSGNTYYLGGTASGLTAESSSANALIWDFSNGSSGGVISTDIGDTPYYLVDNGTTAGISSSNSSTSWTWDSSNQLSTGGNYLNVASSFAEGQNVIASWDFETDPSTAGWTFVDSDGDGYNWTWNNSAQISPHNGNGKIYSESYNKATTTPLNPDNWAITPGVTIDNIGEVVFSIWACAQDNRYTDERFRLYAGNTASISSMVPISEEISISQFMTKEATDYYHITADLVGSGLSTGTVYFAIRHYNCYDMFYLNVDDVSVVRKTFTWNADGTSQALTFTPVIFNPEVSTQVRTNNTAVSHSVLSYSLVTEQSAFSQTTETIEAAEYFQWKTVSYTYDVPVTYHTHPTIIPLAYDSVNNTVHINNTGYIVGGTMLGTSGQEGFGYNGKGDIRVSYYAKSDNIGNSLTSNNLDDTKIYTKNDGTRKTVNEYGTGNFAKYIDAKEKFQATLNTDSSNVYGLHFMDASIDISDIVIAPRAVINGVTYRDYQLPEDCIDFRLRTKGYVNFFAGTYFSGNTSFFSLHQIERTGNRITSIKEISEIWGDGNERHPYIYKFSDNSYAYSNGNACSTPGTGDLSGYSMLFNTSWIKYQSDMLSKYIYYFEIPVDNGEYALGCVPGYNGAYLLYLDIGTSAASHASVIGSIDFVYDNGTKIVVVPDTSNVDTSYNYYIPSLTFICTENDMHVSDDPVVLPDINNFVIYVRRYIASGPPEQSTIEYRFTGDHEDYLSTIVTSSRGDQTVDLDE